MKRNPTPKLQLKKESLTTIAGGAWHRTTHRCHETYTGCHTVADCTGPCGSNWPCTLAPCNTDLTCNFC